MNTAIIDKAFKELIFKRGVHEELGVESHTIRNFRWKLNNDQPINLDSKIRLLQKSGWRQPAATFTRAEMISFAKAWNKASQAKKDLGIEYVLDQWERKRLKG